MTTSLPITWPRKFDTDWFEIATNAGAVLIGIGGTAMRFASPRKASQPANVTMNAGTPT